MLSNTEPRPPRKTDTVRLSQRLENMGKLTMCAHLIGPRVLHLRRRTDDPCRREEINVKKMRRRFLGRVPEAASASAGSADPM